jgi:hypothetical protein
MPRCRQVRHSERTSASRQSVDMTGTPARVRQLRSQRRAFGLASSRPARRTIHLIVIAGPCWPVEASRHSSQVSWMLRSRHFLGGLLWPQGRFPILIRPDLRIYMILLCVWFHHTARDPLIQRQQIEAKETIEPDHPASVWAITRGRAVSGEPPQKSAGFTLPALPLLPSPYFGDDPCNPIRNF